ncbi:Protein phosphatase 2C-like 1 [Symbiodinium microadriaticum]|uniref:Protein phosphatase 2C-like 1 n=1 Tax=Symbiodinium microadriaticum TaxID=2951 RepID=A0A1Q9EQV8_SYMMI|nr:Protein phosphatase 2C-like 1 [Symbiodinium microadriaticum]
MDTSMTFEHIKQLCCDIAARVRPSPGAGLSQLLHLASLREVDVPADHLAASLLEWFFDTRPSQAPTAGSGECSDVEFAERLRRQDAAGVGLPSSAGRDLLRRLLRWSPNERLSAKEALKHPWFDDGVDLPPLRVFKSTTSGLAAAPFEAEPQERREEEALWDEESAEETDAGQGASKDEEETDSLNLDTEEDHVFADWEEGDEGEEVADESGEYSIVSSCPGLESHVAVFEDIGRRRAMEDRHSVRNVSGACDGGQAGYLGLFDGHGGEWTAGWLARALHRRLRAQLRPGRLVKSAIEAAFVSFDKDQLLRRSSNVLELGTGSTALVALLCNCSLHLANLGDCRAVGALRDAWPDSASSGAVADEEALWPKGAIVEVADSRIPDLRGQRGNVVEARAAGSSKNHRVVYVVRLKRDGALRPFKSQALRLLSVLRAVRLTKDHKPASPEERQRIEAMGGQIDVLSAKTGEASASFKGSFKDSLIASLNRQWVVPLTPPRGAAGEDNASECANKAVEVPDPSAFSAAATPVFIVLASDGVWDVLEDQLVVDLVWDFLGSVQDPQRGIASALREAAELVVQAAKDRGSTDNLTCAILLLSWEEKTGILC